MLRTPYGGKKDIWASGGDKELATHEHDASFI